MGWTRLDKRCDIPVLFLIVPLVDPSVALENTCSTLIFGLCFFVLGFDPGPFRSLETGCDPGLERGRKTVPIPCATRSLSKSTFYQLEWTYFSRHLCFHILCVYIEHIYEYINIYIPWSDVLKSKHVKSSALIRIPPLKGTHVFFPCSYCFQCI